MQTRARTHTNAHTIKENKNAVFDYSNEFLNL